MCQILFSSEKNPPSEAIVHANESNKDGFGYAWVQDGNVHWSKGYEAKDLTTELVDAYLALPMPKAIHFRLATHGGTLPQLTHPFPLKRGVPHDLKGAAKAVLFHNGIWHQYDDRLRDAILGGTINPNVLKGGMSDSRGMAILAQRFGDEFLDIVGLQTNKVLVLKHDDWVTYGSWNQKEGWSASSSNIFPRPAVKTVEHVGVPLDTAGLPIRGFEVVGGAKAGHLNRHGNVRREFRRRYSRVGGGYVDATLRDMGPGELPTIGERLSEEEAAKDAAFADMRDERFSPLREYEKTDRPSEGSGYLSATFEQMQRNIEDWGQWGVQ